MPRNGTLGITSPNTGVLLRNYVSEGQNVKKGQTLFELSTERKGNSGELSFLVEQQLANRAHSLDTEQRLRITQYEEKKAALVQRLLNLKAENDQLDHEIELAQRRVSLAQQSQSKFETLEASGYVSAAQTQQKQEELIDIRTRSSGLERTKVQLLTTRQQLEADLLAASTGLETDQAQLRRLQAQLRQEIAENSSRKAILITAPEDGIITTVTYAPGQSIASGQALATIIPKLVRPLDNAPELEIHLYAPSRGSGFVVPGQKVLIRYQAFPYQKFGLQKGTIINVSTTPFSPNELPNNVASTILSNYQQSMLGISSNEALYRIKVRPEKATISAYGKELPLKPGMTLEADIMQDSRKIWEWIAEPLLAIYR